MAPVAAFRQATLVTELTVIVMEAGAGLMVTKSKAVQPLPSVTVTV